MTRVLRTPVHFVTKQYGSTLEIRRGSKGRGLVEEATTPIFSDENTTYEEGRTRE